jgi:hypothetical protein
MFQSANHFKKVLKFALSVLILPLAGLAQLTFETEDLFMEAGLGDTGITGVFSFTNTGDSTVTVTQVRSSCGCTVPELEKLTYAPGESGEIKAVFSFGSRQGDQRKTVTVETDHPSQARVLLALRTSIPSWGEVSRRNLRWDLLEEGSYEPQEFMIKPKDPERIGVRAVNMLHSGVFEVEQVEEGPEGLHHAGDPQGRHPSRHCALAL